MQQLFGTKKKKEKKIYMYLYVAYIHISSFFSIHLSI